MATLSQLLRYRTEHALHEAGLFFRRDGSIAEVGRRAAARRLACRSDDGARVARGLAHQHGD